MKQRTINAVICKKFDAWVASVQDEALRAQVLHNTVCTGGCIASMLRDEPVNDFDFYFTDKETAHAVASYYVRLFQQATGNFKKEPEAGAISVKSGEDRVTIMVRSAGVASETGDDGYEYFEMSPEDRTKVLEYLEKVMEHPKDDKTKEPAKPRYRPVFLSRNAISLSDDVQLIIRFFGDPDVIHENYDFVHCTNYWSSKTRSVVLRPAALEALLTHELRYVGSKYPLCSFFRMKKFIERGWKCNAGTILKIALNLQQFDLSKLDVLEEQLTGVDVAYFMEVMTKLREKNPDAVDQTYLAQLIDRMF